MIGNGSISMKLNTNKSIVRILACLITVTLSHASETPAPAPAPFIEKLAVYGVIKPGSITTLLAINHGIVSKIPLQVGQNVNRGDILIEVMEKETTRSYRSGIKGGVAKLHVTDGAAVTPGMPLSTVIDPAQKQIEVSLSPQEAEKVKPGADVTLRTTSAPFGKVERVSPLVDPDTGAVLAFVKPGANITQLIGDVVPLDIVVRVINNCKVVPLREVDQYLEKFKIEAISGDSACLGARK